MLGRTHRVSCGRGPAVLRHQLIVVHVRYELQLEIQLSVDSDVYCGAIRKSIVILCIVVDLECHYVCARVDKCFSDDVIVDGEADSSHLLVPLVNARHGNLDIDDARDDVATIVVDDAVLVYVVGRIFLPGKRVSYGSFYKSNPKQVKGCITS